MRIDGRLFFNFGKYRGRPLDEVAREASDDLEWILAGDFWDDTKGLVIDALRTSRRRSEPAA